MKGIVARAERLRVAGRASTAPSSERPRARSDVDAPPVRPSPRQRAAGDGGGAAGRGAGGAACETPCARRGAADGPERPAERAPPPPAAAELPTYKHSLSLVRAADGSSANSGARAEAPSAPAPSMQSQ